MSTSSSTLLTSHWFHFGSNRFFVVLFRWFRFNSGWLINRAIYVRLVVLLHPSSSIPLNCGIAVLNASKWPINILFRTTICVPAYGGGEARWGEVEKRHLHVAHERHVGPFHFPSMAFQTTIADLEPHSTWTEHTGIRDAHTHTHARMQVSRLDTQPGYTDFNSAYGINITADEIIYNIKMKYVLDWLYKQKKNGWAYRRYICEALSSIQNRIFAIFIGYLFHYFNPLKQRRNLFLPFGPRQSAPSDISRNKRAKQQNEMVQLWLSWSVRFSHANNQRSYSDMTVPWRWHFTYEYEQNMYVRTFQTSSALRFLIACLFCVIFMCDVDAVGIQWQTRNMAWSVAWPFSSSLSSERILRFSRQSKNARGKPLMLFRFGHGLAGCQGWFSSLSSCHTKKIKTYIHCGWPPQRFRFEGKALFVLYEQGWRTYRDNRLPLRSPCPRLSHKLLMICLSFHFVFEKKGNELTSRDVNPVASLVARQTIWLVW